MDAEFVAEAPQVAVPMPPAVPPMQPMFQQGVQGMLYLVAVVFMPEKEDIRIRLFILVLPIIREDLPSRDLSIGRRGRHGRNGVRRLIRF